MSDFADEASRVEEQQREDALALLRNRPRPIANLSSQCMDCEGPIERARLAAVPHCQRCIDCQRIHEGRRV
ncbi:MAG: TraR/DksA C4-type zinc finger protein [Xanthomonadales bacterium]|nr:TraR/DksA C4-type zinc finger protein [Xanthomonadales bacterium]